MNSERRWKAALLKRVVLNSFAGALLAAPVGALCGLIVSAVFLWLENSLSVALRIPPAPGFIALITQSNIAGFAVLGALLGAIVFAVATARAQPGELFAPLRMLIGRVLLGQIVGTVGFCSLYLCVEAARGAATSQPFYLFASGDTVWLIIGSLALMSFGALAGALSKRT